jgi:2-octaprenyl-6-methoxyphenol hydroxylase
MGSDNKQDDFDILIVGGGLVGSVLAIALKDSPYKVGLIEAKPFEKASHSGLDGRSFALSHSSIAILEQLGLWQALMPYACSIQKIHISERYGWAQARLEASEHQMEQFGAVIEHDPLMASFYQILESAANIQLITPAIVQTVNPLPNNVEVIATINNQITSFHSNLLIACDGANSVVRKALDVPIETHRYLQHALVCNIKLNRHHQHTAYERFMGNEMMAMLPLTENRQALVWAMDEMTAKERKNLSTADFLQMLQKTFGYRLGRFLDVGERKCFPLAMSYMTQTVFGRSIFIGNAAHTLHPIAGQGFNLGLRDVGFLAQLLLDCGDAQQNVLKLDELRAADQANTRRFTHGLINIFTSYAQKASILRSLGLYVFDNVPAIKKELAYFAAGYSHQNSRLASGLSAKS